MKLPCVQKLSAGVLLLAGLCQGAAADVTTEPQQLKGHTSYVNAVAYSPDGSRIVSGSRDESVKIWDAATGAALMTLKHTDIVNAVAYSPDGSRIVSGSRDGTLKIWETATGAELRSFKGHEYSVGVVAYSPDGRRIASGSNSSGNNLKIWDAATGEELIGINAHSFSVNAIAYSPDGSRIVSCSYMDNVLKIWNAATGEELTSLIVEVRPYSVAYSPDGKHIVSTGYSDVTVWDVTTGAKLMTLTGHQGSIVAVAYSPDGRRIVSGTNSNELKIWDAATGKELMTLTGGGETVAYAPDGNHIVSNYRNYGVAIWRITSGESTSQCAVFDGTQTPHVTIPCLQIGADVFSAGMNIVPAQGLRFKVDLTSIKALAGVTPGQDCAVFPYNGNNLRLNCVDVGGTKFWVELGLVPSASDVQFDLLNAGER